MSNILKLSLTEIVNGIKKKEFSSEEVTKVFIDNSKRFFNKFGVYNKEKKPLKSSDTGE